MKKILESDKTNSLLLLVISVLLGLLIFIGKKQVESIDKISIKFSKFQIESVKANSKLDKTIQLFEQHQKDLYQQELHPTTLRSQKNEKDINHLKSDVNSIKSIIK